MSFAITKSISLISVPSVVWAAITDIELVKKHFSVFDAKEIFKFNKGKILDIVPEKLLHTVYPKMLDGQATFSVEPYHLIYQLEAEGDNITIQITHENIETEDRKAQIGEAWGNMLAEIKQKFDTKV